MTPELWCKVEEIFAAAKELSPEERDDFVRQKCDNDTELEREVISLLRYHDSSSGLLSPDNPPWRGLFSDAARTPAFAFGVAFGPYLIHSQLGSGGMGDVYLAEDTRLRRKVALKLLPAWFNREERLVARFTQEALAASALNHPNVPVVFEAGEIDERHYIASEYVEGSPLTGRTSQGSVPWHEAIEIALQVSRALQAAHAAGIIHRDVKPSNILIANDGTAKLTDFGIAKLVEGIDPQSRGDDSLTATGVVIGTPGYMAPEQAAGVQADARSDLWSLAAVLHEMVTGRKPTPGDPKIRTSSNLPLPLARVLERALQPDPEKRYPNIGEFSAGLNHARHALPLGSHTVLIYGIAVIVLLLAVGYAIQLHRKPHTEHGFRAGDIVKVTTSGNVVDAIISPDSRYVIYSVEQSGQESLRLHQVDPPADIERIPFRDGHYKGLTFAPDGNRFYYTFDPHGYYHDLYEAPVLGGTPRKIVDDIDSPAAISPDGRQLEFVRLNAPKSIAEMHIVGVDGSHDRIVATRPISNQFLALGAAWSHDGKTIYSGAFDEHSKAFLAGVDISSGEQRPLSQAQWDFVGKVSLLGDAQTLVFPILMPRSESYALAQFSIADGRWSAITTDSASYDQAQSAGTDIVTVQTNRLSSVWIAPASAPTSVQRITPPAGHFHAIVWSPDGTIVSSNQTGAFENLWSLARDGAAQQLTQGDFVDINPTVSSSLRTIAFTSNRAGGWTVWTVDKNGNGLRELTGGEGITWSDSSFSPDGSILFGTESGGHSHILRMKRLGEAPSQLLDVDASSPVVSPSGKFMACKIRDKASDMRWEVAEVNLDTLQVVRRYPNIPVDLDRDLRWLPDGTALTYQREENGVSNLWKTAISTGAEVQITHFKEDRIFSFDWSAEGRDLAMVRGIAASDVLLIRHAP
jgi:serine/threonine protein kinase/Tol biopolymer transport system component